MRLEELGVRDDGPEVRGDALREGERARGARVGVGLGLLGAALRVARGAGVARVALALLQRLLAVLCVAGGRDGCAWRGRRARSLRAPRELRRRVGRRALLGELGQMAVREAVANAAPVRLLQRQLLWQLAQRAEVGVRVEVLVLQVHEASKVN